MTDAVRPPLMLDDYENAVDEILALADRYEQSANYWQDPELRNVAEDIRSIVRDNLGGVW